MPPGRSATGQEPTVVVPIASWRAAQAAGEGHARGLGLLRALRVYFTAPIAHQKMVASTAPSSIPYSIPVMDGVAQHRAGCLFDLGLLLGSEHGEAVSSCHARVAPW
jgi:hypothetical protein